MFTDNLQKRREARRRKILEQSENRIRLITGEVDCKKTSSEQLFANKNCNGSGNIEVSLNHEQTYRVINDISFSQKTEAGALDDNCNAPTESITSTEAPANNELPVYTNDSVLSLKSRYFIYSLTAILFRISIELNSHHPYLENMVLTFALIKCGTLGVYGLAVPETTPFLISLLLFSGISSNRIKLYIKFFVTSVYVLHEFSLYMFAFVLSHLFISKYKFYCE